MRILLLRTCVSWWMIPATWTLVFLLFYLMCGFDQAVKHCKELTDTYWNGFDD